MFAGEWTDAVRDGGGFGSPLPGHAAGPDCKTPVCFSMIVLPVCSSMMMPLPVSP